MSNEDGADQVQDVTEEQVQPQGEEEVGLHDMMETVTVTDHWGRRVEIT